MRLAFVMLAVLVAGCGEQYPTPQPPPLRGASEVRITVNGDGLHPIATITDPARVAKVVAFVNANLSGWETPMFGVPVPGITAQFYTGTQFQGHFGVGKNFFETNRGCTFCSRSASRQEVMEFIALLDVDPGYLDINYRGPPRDTSPTPAPSPAP